MRFIRQKNLRFVLLVWTSILFLLVPNVFAAPVKLLITHDVHGYVDSLSEKIGYANLKGYADALTEKGDRVFLLDAGDTFSGNVYAQFDHGRFVAQLVGMMGYTVLVPGNHAFDYNLDEKDPFYYSSTLLKTVRAYSPISVHAIAANLQLRTGESVSG